MKHKALLCVITLVAFLTVASFSEAQAASTLDNIKTILDSGTVKTVGVTVGGAAVVGNVPLQSISTSQFPLLIVDDQKTPLKAVIDLSRVVAFVFWSKLGVLNLYL
jgi:hypothetical protein